MSPAPAEFEARIAGLAGDVPIALLPVRIEARFVADELRVRIFPDQIHLDTHEPELTARERKAGEAYWRSRFAAPDADARTSSPWVDLCATVEPSRAVWVVEALTPLNLDELGRPVAPVFPQTTERESEWSVAARAVALPRRWLVVGVRDGVEVARAWTEQVAERLDVSPAPELEDPGADGEVELQDPARWLVDFDEAERAGMAVRIPDAEVSGGLAGGFDQLLVLGVDWDLTPAAAARSIRRLLAHHAYTDGLSAITPGTPTNVTAATRPGSAPSDELLVAALDPEGRPAPDAVAGTGLDRLCRGLGLPLAAGDLLTAVPGAEGRSQETEARLADVLWESTIGSFLGEVLRPVVPDAQSRLLREHVREHLFPGGPFPALRISRQPYGILPVLARGFETDPAEPVEAGLLGVLDKLRIFWERAVAVVPRLGRTADLDADLDELLQTTPLTAAVRFRTVLGPLTVSSTVGLDRHAVAQQYIGSMLGVHLDIPPPTPWNEFALHPGHQRLDRPLVADGTAARLADVAELARTSGRFEGLKDHEAEVLTLLEAMALYAAERELHRADMATINGFRVATGQLDSLPEIGTLPWAEYVGIEAPEPVPAGSVRVTTPSEASRVVIPSVTGQQTVRGFVTEALSAAPDGAEVATLQRVLAGLDDLGTRDADELDRALRGLLDVCSHRLDAWYTSLATRRLAAVRATTPEGVHLGGYGWLDDLRPATGAGVNHGFVHAPSLAQAATAAVLRSGHLAHHDPEHEALEIDLTAERVRTALGLLDGVAQGQPLAALLGYRFERAVRDRGVGLAQYIMPIRRLAPLRPDGAAPAPPTVSDHVAARDVVDGVALLERWRTEGPALFDALQQLVTFPPPPAEVFVMPPQHQRDQLAVELARLADGYDAVADLLLAEAVHQNVLGNHERAAAALAAMDRQGRPPRIEFVRTPRTGKSYTQRLLVLLADDTYPPSWPAPVRDSRSLAEPRLDAWLARILGDPRRIRFAANVTGAAAPLVVRFDELGLSPLAAVLAGQAPGRDEPSELEERLRQAFLAARPASAAGAAVMLLDEPPPGDVRFVGLGAFRALARRAHTLITTHRPAAAGDLALPQDEVGDRFDDAELGVRADAVAAAYARALARIDTALGAAGPTARQLAEALWAAADLGVDGSVPRELTDGGPASVEELLTQARSVAATMTTASKRAGELTGADRVKALLGPHFPVLPMFSVADPDPLRRSRAARTALCGGDDLAPSAWLRRMALVREGVERFARVLGGAELIHSDVVPRDLAVLQLPHTAGDRWLALPYDEVPAGELAVVAHTSGTVDFAAPLAGLFVDGWTETIPGREETTGIAFHHDAPGSRAPQTILLAVPPAITDPAWSVETILDTLTEAQQLARIRGVGPDRVEWVGTMLPAIVLPDPASPDAPAVPLKRLATASTGED